MNWPSKKCMGCKGPVYTLVDFGRQPPSNRFLESGERPVDLHQLILGQCNSCGLVQLVDPMPAPMVRSKFPWLTYNEPEGHLDSVVEELQRLPHVAPSSVFAGLTYKDDSTLARLQRSGFGNTFRIDASVDLGLADPAAGLESIQEAFSAERSEQIANRRGKADVLIARHVVEHAHDLTGLLNGVAPLLKEIGYFVLEIPDSTKFLEACDYSFVWEEHITYFSPSTLTSALAANGWRIVEMRKYGYALEDSLIAIASRGAPAERPTHPSVEELRRGRTYAERFPKVRSSYRELFAKWHAAGKRVALFGAGHLAAKFVNFFELRDYIYCVIDDNANKQRLSMPGSGLPILSSAVLEHEHIDLCLLCLNPESEQKVLSAKKQYLAHGGEFRSIFRLSPLAIQAAP